jgi:hypothetical protein
MAFKNNALYTSETEKKKNTEVDLIFVYLHFGKLRWDFFKVLFLPSSRWHIKDKCYTFYENHPTRLSQLRKKKKEEIFVCRPIAEPQFLSSPPN